ncbi:MAG: hypothetical protein EPO07_11695 [Verrucomicrobia bacterium]|nr:MAG: hypothetical protein EPO07_11695 [Verrucomicrobiota bacterium]
MKTGKAILLGCGIAVVVMLIVLFGGGVAVYKLAQDPQGMRVQIESPAKVKVDDEFEVRLLVVNEREGKSLKVASIDWSEDYLQGVTIRSCEPLARGSSLTGKDGGGSYSFEKLVPAGATNVFTFHMRAKRVGNFKGEVDVYEGLRLMTVLAELEVTE